MPSMMKSRLVRARGLKPVHVCPTCKDRQVAPRAGAWIETSLRLHHITALLSRLVRARGLKLISVNAVVKAKMSRLVRARGLKQRFGNGVVKTPSRASCGRVD